MRKRFVVLGLLAVFGLLGGALSWLAGRGNFGEIDGTGVAPTGGPRFAERIAAVEEDEEELRAISEQRV